MKPLLTACCFFCWIAVAKGQLIQTGRYNFYDGISKGLIKDVITDPLGFLWVATDEGLIRFNGKNPIFFKDELKGGFAKGFLIRKDHSLLVVHDFGVTEIINKTDTTYFRKLIDGSEKRRNDRLFYPKILFEDRHGILWIGEDQSVVRYTKGKLKRYPFHPNINSGNIYRSFSFVEDQEGTLWMLSFNGQLYWYDEKKETFEPCPLDFPLSRAGSFTKIKGNTYWIGGQQGLVEVKLQNKKISNWRPIPSPGNISRALLVDGQQFYVGTWANGLYSANIQSPSIRFSPITTLPFQDILALQHDENNGLWVVGGENIVSLTPGFFKELHLDNAEVSVEVLGKLPNGNIVMTSWQRMYFIQVDPNSQYLHSSSIPIKIAPISLFCEADKLWFGELDGTLHTYDLKKRQFTPVPGILPSSSPITKIVKDSLGNIWASGNEQHGLIRISKDGKLHFYNNDGIGQSKSLYVSPTGVLHIGGSSPNGFIYFYNAEKDNFVNLSAFFNFKTAKPFIVNDLVMDRNGAFFLGTSDGLFKVRFLTSDQKKWSLAQVDLKKVPINEPIKSLLLNEDGTLWVATSSGLIAYDGQSSLLFDRTSGLSGANPVIRGLLLDNQKNLWIGTTKGLALFQRNISQKKLTPTPIFSGLKVDGIKQRLEDQYLLHLPPRSNVEIEFLSLSFPSEKLQFQTRLLKPQQQAWSTPSTQNNLLLSSLKPGNYELQVRAQQHGGFKWSKPATISFVVETAWYQQWWAIVLFSAAFVVFMWGALRVYNWRLVQQKKNLERIISIRTDEVKRQKDQIIQQQEQNRELKEKQLQAEIDNKNKQLMIYTLHLIQKNESLKELQLEINRAIRQTETKDKSDLRLFSSLIDYSFRNDAEWEKFKLYFESVHTHFFESILKAHPALTPQELRMCALIRLNLSILETATILGISAESVKTSRSRLRKKMELANPTSLVDHVMRF